MSCKEKHGTAKTLTRQVSSRRTLDNNNANAAQMCKERLADTNGVDSVVCVCVCVCFL